MTLKNKILCMLLSGFMVLSFAACETGDIVEAGAPAGVDSKPTISVPEKPTVSEQSKEESEIVEEDKIEYPLTMYFSSGAGAWYSKIVIHANGSFEGEHHDSDMGDNGEEYPNGTLYQCKFKGRFSKLQKINDYTYSLTLESVEIEDANAEDRIEDGMLVVQSYPYGLMNKDNSGYGTDFLLFTPNTDIETIRNDYQDNGIEEFLFSWSGRLEDEQNGKLNAYGLLNTHTGEGFFTWVVIE